MPTIMYADTNTLTTHGSDTAPTTQPRFRMLVRSAMMMSWTSCRPVLPIVYSTSPPATSRTFLLAATTIKPRA
jgi:hypothetical protein